MAVRFVEEVELINNMINNEQQLATRRVKTYKPRQNPFLYNDDEFRNKYRFSKSGVQYLNGLFGESLAMDGRGGSFTSTFQILVALRYWGRNQIQDDGSDMHGLSQQSITNICRRVARAILEKREDYIKMPTSSNEQLESMFKFENISGFKRVIGAIDCTHIKIPKVQGPSGQFYINRKGYSSLNVQVICDASLKIRNIVAHWRGSTHDSRIFNESRIKESFVLGHYHGRLLGDSGYACTPYLFTPLLNPQTVKEEAYNYAHIRTRNTIERAFGVWKNRFLCLLQGFRTNLNNTKMYIVALAVLHNIAIELGEEQFLNTVDSAVHLPTQPIVPVTQQHNLQGAAVRARFIEDHF